MPSPATAVRLSEIVSALSYALDITEGQPEGHAVRTCLIGMRLARDLQLDSATRSALFYALILKDLGCSSNSARMAALFGADDLELKRKVKLFDWTRPIQVLGYIYRNSLPGRSAFRKLLRTISIAARGRSEPREAERIRCDRGAEIARMIGLPEESARAILHLDEHWDGGGYPRSLRGGEIPMTSRLMGLAQSVEVYWREYGAAAACAMARERSGTWFDPELVRVLDAIEKDAEFWTRLGRADIRDQLSTLEPEDLVMTADGDRLDLIARAFARVIDAKSPWTFRHSERTASIAAGIGRTLGLGPSSIRDIRLAALLHDIGKLGVSNRVLDKSGPLSDSEWKEMRSHAEKTRDLLIRVPCLAGVAELAGAHHERLDGSGYFRGIGHAGLTAEARAIPVADIYEALTADRPYRAGLSKEEVFKIMRPQAGTRICGDSFQALEAFLTTEEGRAF